MAKVIHECPICGQEFMGHGNNPAPLDIKEPVCDECNLDYVIPARLREAGYNVDDIEDMVDHKASDYYIEDSDYIDVSDKAQKFEVGDKVRFVYPDQEYSEEIAEIVGYDKNGLYIIQWPDKKYSDSLTDDNLIKE
jgi:hypothetical protein